MADNNNFPEKNILDSRKIGLSAPTKDAEGHPIKGKWASMNFEVAKNEFGIKVWPNDPDDAEKNGKKPITASMPLTIFYQFITLLERAIAHTSETEDFKEKLENCDFIWNRNGGQSTKSETPKPISGVWVGRDKEGNIWLALQVYKRPNVKFVVGATIYNIMYYRDGTPYSNRDASTMAATALMKCLEAAVPRLIIANYVHPVPKEQNGGGNNGGQRSGGQGGGGGGYSNNQGGGNNYNQNNGGGGQSSGGSRASAPADDLMEDLPF